MSRRRAKPRPPVEPLTLTLRIESLVFGGAGLAHAEDGRVVFVAFAAPGELVEANVERVYTDYMEAAVTAVLEPSPDRVEPRCPIFGDCGGCQLQHLSYEAQLREKRTIVLEQLHRLGHFEAPDVRATVGAENPWAYRNHVRFSTGKTWGDVGFIHRRGRGLLKVESCPVIDPWANDLLPSLQGKGQGLHQVQIRHNAASNSYLINPKMPGLQAETGVETGQTAYREHLGGRDFLVSASAFFQVNNAQAEQMVRLISESLPERARVLVDAFAGVGTFAALFADRFERVLAIEESHSAMRDAAENVQGLPNVELHPGKVEEILPLLDVAPDVVLLDPPRPGCAPDVLAAIVRFRPSRVVYVSCNPATLARDLRVLVDGGFALDFVTPIDMFPQTGHIECVAQLSLVDPA